MYVHIIKFDRFKSWSLFLHVLFVSYWYYISSRSIHVIFARIENERKQRKVMLIISYYDGLTHSMSHCWHATGRSAIAVIAIDSVCFVAGPIDASIWRVCPVVLAPGNGKQRVRQQTGITNRMNGDYKHIVRNMIVRVNEIIQWINYPLSFLFELFINSMVTIR